ncbi:MAG: ketopantoate reductase family protein [Dissulfurimicrobium sp.]|uniref:ketopantoate reductase family protein n=1 Tax=Dissulfurimicrobium sp. TaxID=2022436 RepID=UPI00404B6A0D
MEINGKIKLAIVGPGAMGCMLAGYIAHAGGSVSVLDYKDARAKRLSQKGIEVERCGVRFKTFPAISADALMFGVQDVIILLVKASQTAIALEGAKAMIGEETLVVSLQNGIGHENIMVRFVRPECIALGVTAQGATFLREGYIRHLGTGDTIIGLLRPCNWAEVRLMSLVQLLLNAGWPCLMTNDISPYIWRKLLVNVGINAITALTGIKNGEINEIEDAQRLQELAVAEAWRVGKKRGIEMGLTLKDAISFVRSVCEGVKGNISSMLQDRLFQRPTEIDFINGAIVKMGRESGVETPVNEVLSILVKINSIKNWEVVKPD